jgi:hypothetical protein
LQSPRTFHLSATGPYFAGLLLLAMVTFWPTYVSLSPSANSLYTHFHALVATAWVLLLIAQPMLMRSGRLRAHRALGKVSWVLAPVFVLSWALAMAYRKRMQLHARFMICTGLTLIDPVVVRLMLWIDHAPSWNYQWFTFLLTDFVLLLLIWLERKAHAGRWVFPLMLSVFALAQIPALFGLTGQAWWQGFAAWFAGLPLT